MSGWLALLIKTDKWSSTAVDLASLRKYYEVTQCLQSLPQPARKSCLFMSAGYVTPRYSFPCSYSRQLVIHNVMLDAISTRPQTSAL